MPRSSRIHVEGGVYHLISRCLNHEYLLAGEAERRWYLAALERALSRTDTVMIGWCIMSNHAHLVVRSGKRRLSDLMRRVNVSYANWKNRKEKRIGPVFASRDKSILVEEESYLLELIRYIHLNPVRAGLVDRAEDSDWSSMQSYLGLSPTPMWLDTKSVLSRFGDEPGVVSLRFLEFINDGLELKRSEILSGRQWMEYAREVMRAANKAVPVSDFIVGADSFIDQVLDRVQKGVVRVKVEKPPAKAGHRPPIDQLIDLICDVLQLDRGVFDERPKQRGPSRARALLARIWMHHYHGKAVTLARHMHVDPAYISRWYNRALAQTKQLYNTYDAILQRLPEIEIWRVLETGAEVEQRHAPRKVTVNVEVER